MTVSTVRVRALHLLCTSAIGLLACAPAWAAPADPVADPLVTAAPLAAGPVAADEDPQQGDIVVSGRRRAIATAQDQTQVSTLRCSCQRYGAACGWPGS